MEEMTKVKVSFQVTQYMIIATVSLLTVPFLCSSLLTPHQWLLLLELNKKQKLTMGDPLSLSVYVYIYNIAHSVFLYIVM